jgi:citrate lyase beta subunit
MTDAIARARTLLFAPGSDERKLRRALESEADLVVADLEDAVALSKKEEARALVVRLFAEAAATRPRAVRVNGAATDFFAEDVAAIDALDLHAIVLPMATPDGVAALGDEGPPVIALVETAQALRQAYEIASSPRVVALGLGAADLGAELQLEPRADGHEILYARSKLVVDSAAAGIAAPFDLVHLDVADDEGLEGEARLARSLGFRGKICIHPRQLPVVNRVFVPTEAEVAWAEDVTAAYAGAARNGRGALTVDGALVDIAVVQRAERVLARANGGRVGG